MKELLFSVTRNDFRMDFMRAGGKGGQKQNKTSSACRIAHPESGAVGVSRDERSQMQNRKLAFRRCIESKEFQSWMKIKIAEKCMDRAELGRRVDATMADKNLQFEYFTPEA